MTRNLGKLFNGDSSFAIQGEGELPCQNEYNRDLKHFTCPTTPTRRLFLVKCIGRLCGKPTGYVLR